MHTDELIVGLYLAAILLLGVLSGCGIKSLEEYAVVKRSYGWLVIFATLSASFIGGGFSTGNASKVFLIGIANIVALWGFSLKEILVALFIAPRTARISDCISVGQVMGRCYGRPAQLLTGVLGVMVCAGITGAQVGAMGVVFHEFLGISRSLGIYIGCGIVIAYTTIGGMRAIVLTDIVQFIVLAVMVPLTMIVGLVEVGGFEGLRSSVPAENLQIFGNITPLALASLFLSFLLGETLVPPYVQRLLLGSTPRATARGTLWSGIFSIPFFAISGCIGLVALAMNPDLDASLAMPHVINKLLPIGLRGIAVAGVISIVMSSADSFLNAASIALTSDVIQGLRRKALPEHQGLLIAKLTSLLVGLSAVIFAMKIENILDILLFSYNFWSPMLLPALVAALMGAKSDARAFWSGAAAGGAAVAIWYWVLGNPFGIDGIVIGVLANLVMFLLLTYIRPAPRAEMDGYRGQTF